MSCFSHVQLFNTALNVFFSYIYEIEVIYHVTTELQKHGSRPIQARVATCLFYKPELNTEMCFGLYHMIVNA